MKELLVAIALSACGGLPASSQASEPRPSQATRADDPAQSESQLGETECEALFAHVFQVAFEGQRETLPEDERPTEADLEKAKVTLRQELMQSCVGAERSEFHFDCAIAAQNIEAITGCMGEK